MKWFYIFVAILISMPFQAGAAGVDFEDPWEKDPAKQGLYHVEIHPTCTLAVVGQLRKVKSEVGGPEHPFYYRVPLRITNKGKAAILMSGYGDWALVTHYQSRKTGEKKWPNLKVLGMCGTDLHSFTLRPGESKDFEASMSPAAADGEFRFGVSMTDSSLKPEERIVFTEPQVMPR